METTKQDEIYPMRINKYLAHTGKSTRRGADDLIKKKQVFINGKPALLGDKVWSTDTVEVRFRGKPAPLVYKAYNKPKGVAANDMGKEEGKTVKHSATMKDVFPIGALDKDSRGLMILTNDGRITQKLLSSEFAQEKEYVVTVKGNLRENFRAKMEAGLTIDGEQTKKCKVKVLNDNTFRIVMREERRYQIRRMCQALHQDVRDIERVRIVNIELRSLASSAERIIQGEELKEFLTQLGLS